MMRDPSTTHAAAAAAAALLGTPAEIAAARPAVPGRRDLYLLAAASLLATIPVWIPTFPPMTDLPQHAAQITLLREMLHPGFPFAASFDLNWFTPYLFGYMLVYALVPFVGVLAACKVVIALAVMALPLSTALVMSETGTDRRWALLVIPAMYGFSYQWGFLNFVVGAPLGLVFLWLTLRQARQATAAGAIALAAMTVLLFSCHVLVYVFFGAMAGLILLASGKSIPNAILRVLPLAAVVPVVILWGLRAKQAVAIWPEDWDLNWITTTGFYYTNVAEWTTPGGWGWGRTAGLFPRLLGVRPGALATMFGLALFALPFAAGQRVTRRPTRWIPVAVCALVLLLAPGFLFGTEFVYQRFTVFVLPLFLILLEPRQTRPTPRWTWLACGGLAAAWIAVASTNAMRYQSEAAGFDEILAHMEPEQRALAFTFERDSETMITPPFLHYGAWYSALKQGVTDPSAASTHAVPVFYRPEWRPRARPAAFEWIPQQFDWPPFHGEQYRYFIARASSDAGPWMFRHATCNTRLVYHVNHWWLYERDPACTAVSAAPRS